MKTISLVTAFVLLALAAPAHADTLTATISYDAVQGTFLIAYSESTTTIGCKINIKNVTGRRIKVKLTDFGGVVRFDEKIDDDDTEASEAVGAGNGSGELCVDDCSESAAVPSVCFALQPPQGPTSAIPSMGRWGIALLTLLLATSGLLALRRMPAG